MAKRKQPVQDDNADRDDGREYREPQVTSTFPEIHLDAGKLTPSQKELMKLGRDPSTRIIFVDGPAGTTKTFCAVYCGLMALKRGAADKLLYVRTVVESSDSRMGHLPGDISDKFNAYTMPLEDKLAEFMTPGGIKDLKKRQLVQAIPVNFLRGLSWSRMCVVLDEAQNLTVKELKTFLTRIGDECLVFVAGDRSQSDIGERTGFCKVLEMFDDQEARENGIHVFRFTEADILRGGICRFVTTRFAASSKLMR